MTEAQYAHNHTIDEKTGFLESKAYPDAFDTFKKTQFITTLRNNNNRLRKACETVGIAYDTFLKHYRKDQGFHESVERVKAENVEEVVGTLLNCAKDPKKSIDRIFWLKNNTKQYADRDNSAREIKVNINIQGLESARKAQLVIDTEVQEQLQQSSKSFEGQRDRVLPKAITQVLKKDI